MAAVAVTWVLRGVLALEFAAALVVWALGACGWPVAGAVATGALTVLMLTWDEAPTGELAPASRPQCAASRESRYW